MGEIQLSLPDCSTSYGLSQDLPHKRIRALSSRENRGASKRGREEGKKGGGGGGRERENKREIVKKGGGRE